MPNDTPLNIVGNLTQDPELRFTPSGAAVANFTVAATPRYMDRQTNEWKDGETVFMRCTAWREQAENIAETLTRGTRVFASGKLKSKSWEDKETGQKRNALELEVEECGPSLRYATAKVTKVQRSGPQGNQGNQGGNTQQGGGQDPWGSPANQGGNTQQGADDPWGGPAPAQAGAQQGGNQDPWGNTPEPPF